MTYNKNELRSMRSRRAEEIQLLAELKWIKETLAMIKHQENCLQIERLHLESVRTVLKPKFGTSSSKSGHVVSDDQSQEPIPSTSAVNLMQNITVNIGGTQNEVAGKRLDDACNDETLNLGVNYPDFNQFQIQNSDFETEEDDDGEDSDENDMFIDMNMLMNGSFK